MKGAASMRQHYRKAGFSLMEVNMAVFVMAVGILGLVALFPLGLRESYQGKADLQQSMFADYALNQLVAALSQTNITWSEWCQLDHTCWPESMTVSGDSRSKANLPDEVKSVLELPGNWTVDYRIFFDLVSKTEDRPSRRLLGISVRSTDIDVDSWQNYTNNPLYYAEVMFQGDPR